MLRGTGIKTGYELAAGVVIISRRLNRLVLDPIGASRVVALEFTQAYVRLGVEYASGGPAELLDDLYAHSPRELEITPVLSDDVQLTISVHWNPPGLKGSDDPEDFLSGGGARLGASSPAQDRR